MKQATYILYATPAKCLDTVPLRELAAGKHLRKRRDERAENGHVISDRPYEALIGSQETRRSSGAL